MRAIGIAALQQHLRTFLPLSREKLQESAACMRHHMRPPLGAHQVILNGPLPTPHHGSASVSPAHPRRTMAAHVHPNPLPAYRHHGSREPRVTTGGLRTSPRASFNDLPPELIELIIRAVTSHASSLVALMAVDWQHRNAIYDRLFGRPSDSAVGVRAGNPSLTGPTQVGKLHSLGRASICSEAHPTSPGAMPASPR